MHHSLGSPFNQKHRIFILRLIGVMLVPFAVLIHPMLQDRTAGEIMEVLGIGVIFLGILGRFWSILYIGGHKNQRIMADGPYSMCRHPLYLFSTIAVFGFGLMLQSILFALALTGLVFAVLYWTAQREERFLRLEFGRAYDSYCRRTPRIVPNVALFRSDETVVFRVEALRRNFFDALVFIALIPIAESIEALRSTLHLSSVWVY